MSTTQSKHTSKKSKKSRSRSRSRSRKAKAKLDIAFVNKLFDAGVGNINWKTAKLNTQKPILTQAKGKMEITFATSLVSIKEPLKSLDSHLQLQKKDDDDNTLFFMFVKYQKIKNIYVFTTILLRYSQKISDIKNVYQNLFKIMAKHNNKLCETFC